MTYRQFQHQPPKPRKEIRRFEPKAYARLEPKTTKRTTTRTTTSTTTTTTTTKLRWNENGQLSSLLIK